MRKKKYYSLLADGPTVRKKNLRMEMYWNKDESRTIDALRTDRTIAIFGESDARALFNSLTVIFGGGGKQQQGRRNAKQGKDEAGK